MPAGRPGLVAVLVALAIFPLAACSAASNASDSTSAGLAVGPLPPGPLSGVPFRLKILDRKSVG